MTAPLVITSDNKQQKVISDLHDSLSQLAYSHSAAPSAVSSKDLTSLQEAIAAVRLLDIRSTGHSRDPCSRVLEKLSSSSLLLVQQLLAPPASLFSPGGGAPCDPEQDLADAGSMYRDVSAAKLQLLLLLLQQLGQLELPAADSTAPITEETRRERNRPTYVVGIVEIVEEGNVEAPTAEQQAAAKLQQLILQVLLVCALYAQQDTTHCSITSAITSSSSSTSYHSSTGNNGASTNSSSSTCCASYDAFCSGIVQQGLQLATTWSNAACQQQCQQLLQHMAAAAVLPDSIAQQQQQRWQQKQQHRARQADVQVSVVQQQSQQEQNWLVLLSCLLPQLLDCLRDTIMAQHRHNRAQEKGEIGAYKGPDTFQRCLAARQLAWITQHLQQQQHRQDRQQEQQQQLVGLLLPLLLAAIDDPSPAVQRYGQAGLGWLGLTGDPADLRWHRLLLLDAARRLVVGCEQTCWATAMPAATSLIMALEGKNVRAAGYHDLLQELITEAQRNGHKPPQRLIFMGCVGRLLPCIGLYIVRHFSQLMPLLLEWTHAYDEASVLAAVQTLGGVVQYAWPRMGAHAQVLWEHLVEVVSTAEERYWLETGRKQHLPEQQQQQQHINSPVVEAAVAVGSLLAGCSGDELAGHL